MKLELTHKGAEDLRTFANALPLAVNSIVEDTHELMAKYVPLADTLGVREEPFGDMLLQIRSAQELAADALLFLPPKMQDVADQIDDFVSRTSTVNR